MSDSQIVLEQTRSTLDQQIEELRDQRNQALRLLRIYVAVTAFLIAGATTLIATSGTPTLFDEPLIQNGNLVAPLVSAVGLLLIAYGVGLFYRGILSVLRVLSPESIIKFGWFYPIYLIGYVIWNRDVPEKESYHTVISPGFNDANLEDLSVDYLIEQNTAGIQRNINTIESNREHLSLVYDQIAMGLSVILFGLLPFAFGLS